MDGETIYRTDLRSDALMNIERWMHRIVNRMLVSLHEKFHTMIDNIVNRVFYSLHDKFRTIADKIVSLTRGAPRRRGWCDGAG